MSIEEALMILNDCDSQKFLSNGEEFSSSKHENSYIYICIQN